MSPTTSEALSSKPGSEENRDRTPEEIRQEIFNHREAISDTINRLDDRIQEVIDWRTYVADHPYIALGLAAGVGCMVANFFKPKPSPQERIMDALADGFEDVFYQARHRFGNVLETAAPRRASAIQAALLGFAAQAATNYLRGKVLDQETSPQTLTNEQRGSYGNKTDNTGRDERQ